MRPLARLLVAFALVIPLLNVTTANAAAGQLDGSFGNAGIVQVSGAPSGVTINDVALAPGGKIVVAGTYEYHPNPPPSFDIRQDFFVARLLPGGALDTTFSGDGWLTASIDTLDEAQGVAVQPDGKIVVVGLSRGGIAVMRHLTIARFTAAGAFDTSFNGQGWDIPEPEFVDGGEFRDVVIGSDGSIYAGGTVDQYGVAFGIMKYAPDGGIEPYGGESWGARIDFGGFQDDLFGLALQPDGKLVAAGMAEIASSNTYDFALARLTTTGALDTTFSGDGKATSDVGSEDSAYGVAVAPDGKIIATGTRTRFGSEEGNDFTVLRYTSAGVLDTTFDGDGTVTNVFGTSGSVSASVAVQADGKVVVGGTRNGTDIQLPDMAVARFTNTGALDASFGANGTVQTDTDNYEFGSSLLLQPDGKIVLAGEAGFPMVVRYLGDGAPPPPPGAKVVAVQDFSFRPGTVKPNAGQAVQWNFAGPSSHTATDNTGMGLFDSGPKGPGTSFTYTFTAAGTYAYHCTIHSTMKPGKVQVPVTASPSSGTTATTFTVTWASAAPGTGFVFDVQLKRPGGRFVTWRSGVTAPSALFLSDAGTGAYGFRARLRNTANGHAAKWSAVRSITVS